MPQRNEKITQKELLYLHQAFEEVVKNNPQKAAAILADEPASPQTAKQLSYDQLNQDANQLARYLQKRQVGPERIVAICLERSFEALTAVLAIHKAGGAFLFLDPHLPQERLDFMVADAGVSSNFDSGSMAGSICPFQRSSSGYGSRLARY